LEDNMKDHLSSLEKYCKKNEYKGYSLYDSHTSSIPFEKLGHTLSFLVNQFVKRAPLNIRPVIGVKKQSNPKGMGLFLQSYSLQKKYGNPLGIDDLDERISYFFRWLKNNYSKGYSGYCWGYHYPWPKSDGIVVPAHTPNSVVTAFNIRAIFQYYLLTQDDSCLEMISGARKFIMNDIPRTENEMGLCFAYTPVKRDMTINANLLAAEVLAYDDYVHGKDEFQEVLAKVLEFTLNHQNEDGSWYYSHHTETGKPKKQIDFHQGYILESIKRVCDYSTLNIEDYRESINLGLSFYRQNQFSDEGTAYWRLPKKWPVDIHNQSQGIITFTMFRDFAPEYFEFALKIANWTTDNMQDANGNFYYQKWPLLTNKVSYMRWNQAWMMLALTNLIGGQEQ